MGAAVEVEAEKTVEWRLSGGGSGVGLGGGGGDGVRKCWGGGGRSGG